MLLATVVLSMGQCSRVRATVVPDQRPWRKSLERLALRSVCAKCRAAHAGHLGIRPCIYTIPRSLHPCFCSINPADTNYRIQSSPDEPDIAAFPPLIPATLSDSSMAIPLSRQQHPTHKSAPHLPHTPSGKQVYSKVRKPPSQAL
jgi:hypothetical protein